MFSCLTSCACVRAFIIIVPLLRHGNITNKCAPDSSSTDTAKNARDWKLIDTVVRRKRRHGHAMSTLCRLAALVAFCLSGCHGLAGGGGGGFDAAEFRRLLQSQGRYSDQLYSGCRDYGDYAGRVSGPIISVVDGRAAHRRPYTHEVITNVWWCARVSPFFVMFRCCVCARTCYGTFVDALTHTTFYATSIYTLYV